MLERSEEGVKLKGVKAMSSARLSGPPNIGVTAPSSLYKSEAIGLRGYTPTVFRTEHLPDTETPDSSYQFWCKAVCLLHVGWGPDLGYSVSRVQFHKDL